MPPPPPYTKSELLAISSGLCKLCIRPRGTDGTRLFCRPCATAIRNAQRSAKGVTGPCSSCHSADRFSIKHTLCRACAKAQPRRRGRPFALPPQTDPISAQEMGHTPRPPPPKARRPYPGLRALAQKLARSAAEEPSNEK